MNLISSLRAGLVALIFVASAAFAGPVNINTASEAQLAEALTGIGSARAAAIVEYRKANGPFRRAEDLSKVEGIGPHIVKLNQDLIKTTEPSAKK